MILIPSAGFADLTEEVRSVADFSSISASISGRIEVRQGSEPALSIEAKPETLALIVTDVEDGELRIYQEDGGSWWRNSGPIRITVTYRTLTGLTMSGSADVTTDAITAAEFQVGIAGSSNIEVPALTTEMLAVQVAGSGDLEVQALAASRAELKVSGSGDVALEGQAGELTVVVNGSGNVDVADLAAEVAEVSVSGSGDVEVWATDTLDVRIVGSGNVAYRGDPELSSRVMGSGDLERL